MVKLAPGVNLFNVVCAAFMCEDPKSEKNTVKPFCFLHFYDPRL